MTPTRLILAPQLPTKLRYTQWWLPEMLKHLSPHFEEVRVLWGHATDIMSAAAPGNFADPTDAIEHELAQLEQYLALRSTFTHSDVLLHCDLSYPGIFHSVLAHKRPHRAVVFCHATALNNHDIFEPIRDEKWHLEMGAAALYDRVLVATEYHKSKVYRVPWTSGSGGFGNVRAMGALPYPPESILPSPSMNDRSLEFLSVARPTPQKVNKGVEDCLREAGHPVHRYALISGWREYYRILDEARFLIITSREETYGYQVVDALLRGCKPIAPAAYSYPELLPERFLYDPRDSPQLRAERILAIATREYDSPAPELLCHQAATDFWTNLVKELKKWP